MIHVMKPLRSSTSQYDGGTSRDDCVGDWSKEERRRHSRSLHEHRNRSSIQGGEKAYRSSTTSAAARAANAKGLRRSTSSRGQSECKRDGLSRSESNRERSRRNPIESNTKSKTSKHRRASDSLALAPGISSRRTTREVKDHLPASKMRGVNPDSMRHSTGQNRDVCYRYGRSSLSSSAIDENGMDVSSHSRRSLLSRSSSARDKSFSGNGNRFKVPMEHDGGVLCLCSIPQERKVDYQLQSPPQFLSGGADGLIKLWEIQQSHDGSGFMPRLVQTYVGHSSYIHSVAVIGTVDTRRYAMAVQIDEDKRSRDRGGVGPRSGFMRRKPSKLGMRRSSSAGCFLQTADEDSVSCQTTSSGGSAKSHQTGLQGVGKKQQHRGLKGLKHQLSSIPSMRSLALDGSEHGEAFLGKRTLFVSASKDNTCRVWSLDSESDILDECDEYDESDTCSRDSSKGDALSRGLLLRDKEGQVVVGITCVCALPNIGNREEDLDCSERSCNTQSTERSSAKDEDRRERSVIIAMFCSGESDGSVRIWEVRLMVESRSNRPVCVYITNEMQCFNGDPKVGAPITVLRCTPAYDVYEDDYTHAAIFAGDTSGIIRRYSPADLNHPNRGSNRDLKDGWFFSGIFSGHQHSVSDMSLLTSSSILPLIVDDADSTCYNEGTLLISSDEDGTICVWDAYDEALQVEEAEVRAKRNGFHGRGRRAQLQDQSIADHLRNLRRLRKRSALWEIELNDDEDDDPDSPYNSLMSSSGGPPLAIKVEELKERVGATSIGTLNNGNLMSAGTTDGAIRLWNVGSGLYEGAYNFGRNVQIWSLVMMGDEYFSGQVEYERDFLRTSYTSNWTEGTESSEVRKSGIIICGDNRGRIRVLRKT